MRKFKLIFVFPIFLLTFSFFSVHAQTIVWSEDFSYADGTTQGSGSPPKWTVDVSACTFDGDDHFEVRSNQMEGNDLDGEAIWRSQGIDISGYANVSVTVDLSEVGDLEATDYIRVYYQIDGGAENLFDTNGDVSDDFDNLVAAQTNLSGNTLTIVIRVQNNATTEFIRFDNVTVREGTPTLDHFSIDPISDQKVGVPFSITVTAKDASDATVTSFTGTVDISDLSGTISPTVSGNFSSGVWTGSVTISSEYTADQITVTNSGGSETGTSNSFDVTSDPGPGSVVINELMWMGSSLSTADEWIELRNTTGNDIDISGWQLTKLSAGVENIMVEIPAGSTIPAKGYFLISNYDEANSQIAVTPDLVDASVSLANSQLQIKLYDGQWDGGGTLIDVADDGVGDPAAGDNTNKYSMMRVAPPGDGTLAASWFTADIAEGWDAGAAEKGTPGSANYIFEVTSHTPNQNEINVEPSTNIQVNFSLDIDVNTVNEDNFSVVGSWTGKISGNYAVNGNVVTFDPNNDFKYGEVVSITLTSGIHATNGLPLTNPYSWQFMVENEETCAIFAESGQNYSDTSSWHVAVGDIDGDNDLDIFIAKCESDPSDKILLNDGHGFFTYSGQSFGSTQSYGVALGDLDGDGDLDAFITKRTSPDEVWLNDGNGNFTNSGQSLDNPYSFNVTLGDVDGDGDLDAFIATVNFSNKLLFNDGSGQFTDSGQDFGNSVCPDIALGDLDGDGDLDAFFAMPYGVPDEVWLNDGDGNFTNSGQAVGNTGSWSVDLGDVDGDGDLDAYVANADDDPANCGNGVWLNDGNGNFTDSGQNLGNSASLSVVLADFDGDYDLDAFVINFANSATSDQPNKLWLNDGNGNFTDSGQNIGNFSSMALGVGDFDSDGDMDAFVANRNFQSSKVWFNCIDFGDAPDPLLATDGEYPTLMINNGARHNVVDDFYLGQTADGETNGLQSAASNGDDSDNLDDEDGVTFGQLIVGSTAGIKVDVILPQGIAQATLHAWMDFNADGTWDDANEHIIAGENVTPGTNNFIINIPANAIVSNTFARFRLGSQLPAMPTGYAADGEVEDYMVYLDNDTDGDGIGDHAENSGDRDGDSIPDNEDYDPSGWIYNQDNGDIISGGTISVSPSAGVTIIHDGSNGYYQFTVSQSGDYTLSYTPPGGFNLSSSCTAQSGTLDLDPVTDPTPYVVGTGSKDGTTNKMTNWNCGDNPYYWNFHLEVGDPVIINNNIPLEPRPTNVVLSSFTASAVENGISITWTTETEPDNAGFNIFRSQNESSDYVKINENLIPAQGDAMTGASYTYLDAPEQAGNYFYKLQSVSLTGDTSFYGPVSVVLTEVALRKMATPVEFSLRQNYPNPFNPETSIEYGLPEPAQVKITIYDINGHEIRNLVSGNQAAGIHSVKWDGRDETGNKVVSGIYFYHFKAIGAKKVFSQTNKMILMK